MVGSQSVGSMGDNQNEGWAGYRIDQVALKADLSLPTLPNVVCILAGGNDVYQRFNTNEMSKRMGDLIDKILNAVPGTTVIVSTLMRNWDARNDAIMVVYNANLTQVVASRASAGKKVFLVNNNSTVSFRFYSRFHGTQALISTPPPFLPALHKVMNADTA